MADTQLLCVICGLLEDSHADLGHDYLSWSDWMSATMQRGLQFARRGADPGSSLYIQLEDRLIITLQNSLTGIEVDVSYRLQRPDGVIIPGVHQIFPLNTRTVQVFQFPLAEGMLLSVDAATPTAAVRKGQCFVNLTVGRGITATPQMLYDLTEGYVVTGNDIGWPWPDSNYSVDQVGQLRAVNVANPAAGADWNTAVPAGARWQLLSWSAALTSSATAGTRGVASQMTDGAGHILYNGVSPSGQAVSITVIYNASSNGAQALSSGNVGLTLPAPAMMLQGWTIGSITANLSATDQWANIWLGVMEWLEP